MINVIIKTGSIHAATYWQYTIYYTILYYIYYTTFINHYICLYFYSFAFILCLAFMLHHLTVDGKEKNTYIWSASSVCISNPNVCFFLSMKGMCLCVSLHCIKTPILYTWRKIWQPQRCGLHAGNFYNLNVLPMKSTSSHANADSELEIFLHIYWRTQDPKS